MSVDEVDEARQAAISDAIDSLANSAFEFTGSLNVFQNVDFGKLADELSNEPVYQDAFEAASTMFEKMQNYKQNATSLRDDLTDPATYAQLFESVAKMDAALETLKLSLSTSPTSTTEIIL